MIRKILGPLWRVPEGGKVADRPHPLTMVLGLLGPVTAILAITFTFMGYRLSTESLKTSQEALKTSQRSLSVGQRAYVAIQQGKVDAQLIDDMGEEINPPSKKMGTTTWAKVNFDIHNLGNTPADLAMVNVVLNTGGPRGFRFYNIGADDLQTATPEDPNGLRVSLAISGSVGPKSYMHKELTMNIQSIEPFSGADFSLNFQLIFKDVFGEKQDIQWCWMQGTGAKSRFPRSCVGASKAFLFAKP